MAINETMTFTEVLATNTQNDYLVALGIFLSLFIVLKLFDSYFVYVLQKAAKKTKMQYDDMVVGFLEELNWPFYAYIALYIGSLFIALPRLIEQTLWYLLLLCLVYYAAKAANGVVNYLFETEIKKRKKKEQASGESMLRVLKVMANIIVWTLALLMLLSNFGVEITPLVASLGVGGIAIALALQTVLSDLFSAFAIYFDKPFEEGDFVIIGGDMGVIKHIGIKTTRIQALGGQELVISNSELTSSRINNYKRMPSRRVVFSFGVEYHTTPKQLREIKKVVSGIISKTDHARLDRVHFKGFGDSSLDFECVYYLDSADYNLYMDAQEKINLAVKEKVENLGIGFAFPTRTVHMIEEPKPKKK